MGVSYARLHPRLRFIAKNLPRAARASGFNARVTSAYRDPRKQAALYSAYLRGETPYPVAPPGTSMHEKGLALDAVSDNQEKLVGLLTSAGLSWFGPSDPVHFELGGAPRRSQGQIEPFESWREGPGSSIPSWAGSLPIVGGVFRTLADPEKEAESGVQKLLDVVLGFL